MWHPPFLQWRADRRTGHTFFSLKSIILPLCLTLLRKWTIELWDKTRSLRHLIINIPMSSGLSEWANEQINKHSGAHARAKRAVRSNQMRAVHAVLLLLVPLLPLFSPPFSSSSSSSSIVILLISFYSWLKWTKTPFSWARERANE